MRAPSTASTILAVALAIAAAADEPTAKRIAEVADQFAFLVKALGMAVPRRP
jgi:hypothetical protein